MQIETSPGNICVSDKVKYELENKLPQTIHASWI